MKKYIFGALLMCLCVFQSYGQEQQLNLLNVASFEKEMMSNKGLLIDIRTPAEFEEGTIEGARNIDFLGDTFKTEISELDKTEPVYIFCKSGGRSAKAHKLLKEEGFENVYELDGGFTAWDETHNK